MLDNRVIVEFEDVTRAVESWRLSRSVGGYKRGFRMTTTLING